MGVPGVPLQGSAILGVITWGTYVATGDYINSLASQYRTLAGESKVAAVWRWSLEVVQGAALIKVFWLDLKPC
uniref:Uncharacterized protein n=1 Tax=Rhodnius prolixus TaxID=13249 RepID=T1I0Y6_RHOPR